MKKMLFCTLLVLFQVIIPAQPNEAKFEKIVVDHSTKPIIVGFKQFSEKKLNNLDPEKRATLHKIANRSWVENCFGLDSHTITSKERQNIESFSDDIQGKMNFEVIPIKGSLLIDGCKNADCSYPSVNCSLVGGVTGIFTSLFGGFLTSVATNNPLFAIFCVSIATMPACGCTTGEVCTCAYYRCCAEREIWNFDNPKK